MQDLRTGRDSGYGIAVAGMPAASPGLPGVQDEPWTIWALDDGEAEPYRVR